LTKLFGLSSKQTVEDNIKMALIDPLSLEKTLREISCRMNVVIAIFGKMCDDAKDGLRLEAAKKLADKKKLIKMGLFYILGPLAEDVVDVLLNGNATAAADETVADTDADETAKSADNTAQADNTLVAKIADNPTAAAKLAANTAADEIIADGIAEASAKTTTKTAATNGLNVQLELLEQVKKLVMLDLEKFRDRMENFSMQELNKVRDMFSVGNRKVTVKDLSEAVQRKGVTADEVAKDLLHKWWDI
jgi:hypothetical protein